MARATTGPLLSAIAGSVGSTTFRNSASGLVVSNRPLRPDRASSAQLDHRRLISDSAGAWTTLDADIKTSWNILARQEPIPSFFSRGRKWTGRQLFTCFFVQAARQLTPLPARWLPTPPLFWLSEEVRVLWFWPVYYTPQPPDYDPPAEGWYSLTSITYWIPSTLNPPPGAPGSTNTPATCYCGYTRLHSGTLPRKWFLATPPSILPQLQPTLGGYLPAMNGMVGGESIAITTGGMPPGITAGMTTPTTRTWDLWIRIAALSDERIYWMPPKNIGNAYSTAGDYTPSSDCMNRERYGPGPGPTFVTVDGNYPKTEV